MQLPTTIRTAEHYARIADKLDDLARALEHRCDGPKDMPDRLKHFAREIRQTLTSRRWIAERKIVLQLNLSRVKLRSAPLGAGYEL